MKSFILISSLDIVIGVTELVVTIQKYHLYYF